LPIVVAENEIDVKVVFFEIGKPYFDTIKSVHYLYKYRPFAYHHFQFTAFDDQSETIGSKEIVSFVDSGPTGDGYQKCGEHKSENVIACDLMIYHKKKMILETVGAQQREFNCEFTVKSQIGGLEKHRLTINVKVELENQTQIISLKKIEEKSTEVKVKQNSTQVYLNDKFNGPVAMFDHPALTGTAVKFEKQFEISPYTSKLIKLTRMQLIIKDLATGSGDILFLLTPETIIQIRTMNRYGKHQPYVKDFIPVKSNEILEVECMSLLHDKENDITYAYCNTQTGGKIFVTSWFSRKPKMLLIKDIRFGKSSITKQIFYHNRELIIFSVEEVSQRTNVQSYLLNTQQDEDSTCGASQTWLSPFIPSSFNVS
jgi:hypothetical protein